MEIGSLTVPDRCCSLSTDKFGAIPMAKKKKQYMPPPPEPAYNDAWLTKYVEMNTAIGGGEPKRIADKVSHGLRIIVRKGAGATFHVQYTVTGRNRRPSIMLGTFPEMSIEEARSLTRPIVELGRRGIDVQDGLEKRLVRELKEQGVNWRA